MQHQPALYDAFLTPVYWTYKAVGAPAMETLCALPFFTVYSRFCPSGMWMCVGGNVLLGAYVGLAALVAALAARHVPSWRRRMRLPSKLKTE